jgi:hypothetical protein
MLCMGTKLNTPEPGWVIVGWIKLAQDCKCRAVVQTVINLF